MIAHDSRCSRVIKPRGAIAISSGDGNCVPIDACCFGSKPMIGCMVKLF